VLGGTGEEVVFAGSHVAGDLCFRRLEEHRGCEFSPDCPLAVEPVVVEPVCVERYALSGTRRAVRVERGGSADLVVPQATAPPGSISRTPAGIALPGTGAAPQ